jgi:hypothetical protein
VQSRQHKLELYGPVYHTRHMCFSTATRPCKT